MYYKVRNPRPAQSRQTVRPHRKVNLLVSLQGSSLGFFRDAFVLQRLLPRPANDERATRVFAQVGILSGRLHGVEDDFQLRTRGDAYERGLWRSISRDARHHA